MEIQKGVVKGEQEFLKSRAKPVRASVKLSEIRPVGLFGITGVANNTQKQERQYENENPLSINSFSINQNFRGKAYKYSYFGLVNNGAQARSLHNIENRMSRGKQVEKVYIHTTI